jgi:hypothetical protein
VAPLHLEQEQLLLFPPRKFLPAVQRLAAAHDSLGQRPDWLQPKGVGVVCVQKNGISKDSFVHFYFGKMYGNCFLASILFDSSADTLPQNGSSARLQSKSSR